MLKPPRRSWKKLALRSNSSNWGDFKAGELKRPPAFCRFLTAFRVHSKEPNQRFFGVSSDPDCRRCPWFGLRAMRSRPPKAGSGQPPRKTVVEDHWFQVFARRTHGLFLYRTQTHSQKFRKPRQRYRSPLFASNAKRRVYRFFASRCCAKITHDRRPASCVRCSLPHCLAQWFCRDEIHRVQPCQACIRCA